MLGANMKEHCAVTGFSRMGSVATACIFDSGLRMADPEIEPKGSVERLRFGGHVADRSWTK
ncbi:MAG: hypothetical protein HW416_2861 [Chloroflexi bacterium]|nr:hypothetical protein [Chloroflexota bacterium]